MRPWVSRPPAPITKERPPHPGRPFVFEQDPGSRARGQGRARKSIDGLMPSQRTGPDGLTPSPMTLAMDMLAIDLRCSSVTEVDPLGRRPEVLTGLERRNIAYLHGEVREYNDHCNIRNSERSTSWQLEKEPGRRVKHSTVA